MDDQVKKVHTEKEHRKRVQKRFHDEGLDHFDPVHALELLLFYSILQKDTKPIARALLDRFGSYTAVMEASEAELKAVKGIGPGAATFLNVVHAAGRYYQVQKAAEEKILDNVEKYGHYLLQRFYGARRETVYLLCLDAKCKLLSCTMVGEGDVNSANIPIRRMVEIALAANATSVVLAHNHPSGIAVPSREDVLTTRQLATALGAMDIILADHIVVADEDFVSMVQSNYYDPRNYIR